MTGKYDLNNKTQIISQSSQAITALIPDNTKYKNDGGICNILTAISTNLFLNSKSITEYAKTFSNLLDKMSHSKYGLFNPVLAFNKNILNKFSISAEFNRGIDISKKYISLADKMKDLEKNRLFLL